MSTGLQILVGPSGILVGELIGDSGRSDGRVNALVDVPHLLQEVLHLEGLRVVMLRALLEELLDQLIGARSLEGIDGDPEEVPHALLLQAMVLDEVRGQAEQRTRASALALHQLS